MRLRLGFPLPPRATGTGRPPPLAYALNSGSVVWSATHSTSSRAPAAVPKQNDRRRLVSPPTHTSRTIDRATM